MLLLRGATAPRKADTLCPPCFNTCSSCEEQLGRAVRTEGQERVSIHAPLARSNKMPALWHMDKRFQYMLLLRGATDAPKRQKALQGFNTCSSCEEQLILRDGTSAGDVSIHAPLARSNLALTFCTVCFVGFNTCSSCEEQLKIKFTFLIQYSFNTCSSCEEQLA